MSARTNKKNSENPVAVTPVSISTVNANNESKAVNPTLHKACVLIQKGNYSAAVDFLAASGRDPSVRNALGVCLMRLGEIDRAVEVFRSFVLVPGTVSERSEVSNASKRNFATALLLKGLPSGAMTVLADIHDPDSTKSARIYWAVRKWEKSLPWLRWLDWKLNRIEPRNCQVPLDFEPGEFDFDVQVEHPNQSGLSRNAVMKVSVLSA
ncbi:MAG: tetratricopeptide repeat protein [Rubripirellula sp.]